MKLALFSLCITLLVQNVFCQCNFSSVRIPVGDTCHLEDINLQIGESVEKCGLLCACDTNHLHCCIESSCAIVYHTTSSVSITESGQLTSQSKRRRRSSFFNWIVKRLKRINDHSGDLFREERFSPTSTAQTTTYIANCIGPTPAPMTTTTTVPFRKK